MPTQGNAPVAAGARGGNNVEPKSTEIGDRNVAPTVGGFNGGSRYQQGCPACPLQQRSGPWPYRKRIGDVRRLYFKLHRRWWIRNDQSGRTFLRVLLALGWPDFAKFTSEFTEQELTALRQEARHFDPTHANIGRELDLTYEQWKQWKLWSIRPADKSWEQVQRDRARDKTAARKAKRQTEQAERAAQHDPREAAVIEAKERIRRRPGCHHPDNEEDVPTIIAAIKGPARDLFPADRASFRRVICRILERLRSGNGMANDTGTNGPFRETGQPVPQLAKPLEYRDVVRQKRDPASREGTRVAHGVSVTTEATMEALQPRERQARWRASMSPERRERERVRNKERRWRKGVRPRHLSLEQTMPWLDEGISRRTWYRRRQEKEAYQWIEGGQPDERRSGQERRSNCNEVEVGAGAPPGSVVEASSDPVPVPISFVQPSSASTSSSPDRASAEPAVSTLQASSDPVTHSSIRPSLAASPPVSTLQVAPAPSYEGRSGQEVEVDGGALLAPASSVTGSSLAASPTVPTLQAASDPSISSSLVRSSPGRASAEPAASTALTRSTTVPEALAWCLARAATLTAAGQSRKDAKATAYAEIAEALQWQIMHPDWWQALYTQFVMQRREEVA